MYTIEIYAGDELFSVVEKTNDSWKLSRQLENKGLFSLEYSNRIIKTINVAYPTFTVVRKINND